MNNALQMAKATLLESAGLQAQDLDTLTGRLMAYDIDYADLYFQYSQSESWSLEDGAVKSGSRSIDRGVGIRAISGEKTGFAYSDELYLPALTKAADAARAGGGREGAADAVRRVPRDGRVPVRHRSGQIGGQVEHADAQVRAGK